jgi:CubicO group peptidase (beta-lactamase class C family)
MRLKAAIIWAVAITASAEPPSLTGLWAARRDFGPAVRGTLNIDGDSAAIAGRSAPVTFASDRRREGRGGSAERRSVSFALPNDEGSFRGEIRGDRIIGHWIQPTGVSTASPMATPVTLIRVQRSRWRGTVTPIDDHMTLYLPITKNGDGTYRAFLRNPERNIGRFSDVHRVALDGPRVKLLGKNDTLLAEGEYDAESDTMSIPSRGGRYDFHRATAAEEAAFHPRGKTPQPYVYRKPPLRDDGWPVASLDDVGISRDGITRLIEKLNHLPIDSVHASDIHAVFIARHGRLVLEEYFHGTNPEEPHDTRSAAKSLTSVLAGAAKLPASTPVYAALGTATNDPRARAMTVEHLLTMAAGLDCDDSDDSSPGNEDVMQEQTKQPDWIRYTLDLKMIRTPGEKSIYCSCQPNLIGGILGRRTGRWLPDLFRDLVATPLQIVHYGINLTPTGEAYMGGGSRFRPRDFMKLGQLMLDGGRWRGRQIVSAEWTKRSTSPITQIAGRQYGYLWWLQDYPYQGRTVRAFFAGGNGGQIVIGVPELDLVIAFYGGNYSDPALFIPQRKLVPEDILPAIE